jgi:hypothetical protein
MCVVGETVLCLSNLCSNTADLQLGKFVTWIRETRVKALFLKPFATIVVYLPCYIKVFGTGRAQFLRELGIKHN